MGCGWSISAPRRRLRRVNATEYIGEKSEFAAYRLLLGDREKLRQEATKLHARHLNCKHFCRSPWGEFYLPQESFFNASPLRVLPWSAHFVYVESDPWREIQYCKACSLWKAIWSCKSSSNLFNEVRAILKSHPHLTRCTDRDGYSALHQAAAAGNAPAARCLLEAGMPVDQLQTYVFERVDRLAGFLWPVMKSATPLHLASFFGRLELVQLLIVHGADVTRSAEVIGLHSVTFPTSAGDYLEDFGGSVTPLYLALQEGHAQVVEALLGVPSARKRQELLMAPINPYCRSDGQPPPLGNKAAQPVASFARPAQLRCILNEAVSSCRGSGKPLLDTAQKNRLALGLLITAVERCSLVILGDNRTCQPMVMECFSDSNHSLQNCERDSLNAFLQTMFLLADFGLLNVPLLVWLSLRIMPSARQRGKYYDKFLSNRVWLAMQVVLVSFGVCPERDMTTEMALCTMRDMCNALLHQVAYFFVPSEGLDLLQAVLELGWSPNQETTDGYTPKDFLPQMSEPEAAEVAPLLRVRRENRVPSLYRLGLRMILAHLADPRKVDKLPLPRSVKKDFFPCVRVHIPWPQIDSLTLLRECTAI